MAASALPAELIRRGDDRRGRVRWTARSYRPGAARYDHRTAAASTEDGRDHLRRTVLPRARPATPRPAPDRPLRLRAKELGAARGPAPVLPALRLLGPHTLEDRRELAIRFLATTKQGLGGPSARRSRRAGPGYSDLALVPGGAIGVRYETAGNIPHSDIAFASFTEGQMDAAQRELRLPRASTTARVQYGSHAVVARRRPTGRPRRRQGHDHRRARPTTCAWSPARTRCDLGAGDHPHRLVPPHRRAGRAADRLGIGTGSAVQQFWLRAEPGQGGTRAAIDTGTPYADAETTCLVRLPGRGTTRLVKRQSGRLPQSADGGHGDRGRPAARRQYGPLRLSTADC
ncbi:exo-alpha-sialidase OS=Streptomyces microflavus OX=1919 GN=Smic_51430 PE=3 SV=1 [Streptomyces microflavus]